ncbi:cytochrome c oxidase subunit 3 [Litoribacter ruber]|uniref:cytochrome c oxidase subunit 3 n=1 Tax=Litoribacter ruber TaxID=702568 RepID=UPI001BDAEE3F|nr:cytochrome c oxidase subunit 3 [Litoribacter ruber]MBT0810369.1 cytochrome c oxidase subunit 3 [Litoribacter ruber]
MEVIAQKLPAKIDYKQFNSPPGGLLMWIVIFLEVITFGIGLARLVYNARLEPELFHTSRLQLNASIGAINTVILLSSGFFLAKGLHAFKQDNYLTTSFYLKWTLLGGWLFTMIKIFEYWNKLDAGLGMGANMFFTSYWLLTGFHLVHVVVGMVILGLMLRSLKTAPEKMALVDVEAGAAFWHMCDLIWLLLFPALYLIF